MERGGGGELEADGNDEGEKDDKHGGNADEAVVSDGVDFSEDDKDDLEGENRGEEGEEELTPTICRSEDGDLEEQDVGESHGKNDQGGSRFPILHA